MSDTLFQPFSEISKTWAGYPLISWEVLLDYIRATTTQTGLRVEAQLVTTVYETGIKVTPAEWALLQLHAHETCPQWNYTIRPSTAV